MKRHIKKVPVSLDDMTKPGIVDAEVDGLFLKKASFVIWVSLPLLNLFGAHLVLLMNCHQKIVVLIDFMWFPSSEVVLYLRKSTTGSCM